jgi:hypothetical protein
VDSTIGKEQEDGFTTLTSPSTAQASTTIIINVMSIGLKNIWLDYNVALAYHPLLVKCCTAGVIMGLADLTGQIIERMRRAPGMSSSSSIEWIRSTRFAVFGFFVLAPWMHFYLHWLDQVLPPTDNPFSATNIVKVLFDQFIQSPVFTSILIGTLAAMEGKSLIQVKKDLRDNLYSTLRASCK